MNSTEIFDTLLKKYKTSSGKKRFPKGIYLPFDKDSNYEILGWLQNSLNVFLANNSYSLEITQPHFNFIHHEGINACAIRRHSENFIGMTKGLVDYSSFLFRNFLRDNDFLKDVLENTQDEAVIISHVQFFDWCKFRNENIIHHDSLSYSPSSFKRKKIAEALFQYYIFFIILHELGHLKQRAQNLTRFEFEGEKGKMTNLKSQVLEMDADKFAVIQLANHLITLYKERNLPENQPFLIFFDNKKTIVRCAVFVLLFMFFMFSSNNKFQKYILEYSHPHPSLRVHYCVILLFDCFVNSSFLDKNEQKEFGKQTINDFGDIMKRIFPNAGLKKYFSLIRDKELQMHHETLQNAAKSMKNLNGYGKY